MTEPLADVGTSLLFENDRVKVWEMALGPGEECGEHRHEMDYLLVLLEGDRIAGVPTDGREVIEADVVPGTVIYLEKGGTEIARNIGSRPYREILIELKD